MRPTSRQRMQRLADDLAADGLVTFIDNPKHRRSKLVRLTRKDDMRYRELNARFLANASNIGTALSEADIRSTTEIVRRLSEDVKARSDGVRRGDARLTVASERQKPRPNEPEALDPLADLGENLAKMGRTNSRK